MRKRPDGDAALLCPQDVERLMGEVPGTAGAYKVPWKDFNHGDYMWAVDSYDLLYKTVLKSLRDF